MLSMWQKSHYFESIRMQNDLEKFLAHRRNDEICYHCGSRQAISLEGDMSLPFSPTAFMYKGKKDTGLVHPGCGGKVILEAMDMRFSYVELEEEYFDENGSRRVT